MIHLPGHLDDMSSWAGRNEHHVQMLELVEISVVSFFIHVALLLVDS